MDIFVAAVFTGYIFKALAIKPPQEFAAIKLFMSLGFL